MALEDVLLGCASRPHVRSAPFTVCLPMAFPAPRGVAIEASVVLGEIRSFSTAFSAILRFGILLTDFFAVRCEGHGL